MVVLLVNVELFIKLWATIYPSVKLQKIISLLLIFFAILLQACKEPGNHQSDVCTQDKVSYQKSDNQNLKTGNGQDYGQLFDGYKGIWFTLGQPYQYGDKYSGGLGTYTAKHRPMAIYSRETNKTYFVYGGTTKASEKHLLCMMGEYDHRTDSLSKPVIVYDKAGVDDPHDNPSLSIDDQGYLWMFVSGRGNRRPGFKYKSNQPYAIDRGFTRIATEEMAYPQPWYITGKGFIHLFTKYTGRRELYFETSEDGVEWSAAQKLAGIKAASDSLGGHYQISAVHGEKIMTFFNRHIQGDPDRRTDLYYLESIDYGKTWQTVGGIKLNIPLTQPQQGRLTDYHTRDKYVYLKDITVDNQGNPLCLYVVSNSHKPGPDYGSRKWKVTHWNGSAWNTYHITNSDHNYDMGSIYIEKDAWRVIAPFAPGPQAHQAGGDIEVWKSTDQGQTWVKESELTSNSRYNHNYVRRPEKAQQEFKAFWADGDPTGFSKSRLYYLGSGNSVNQMPYY